MDGVEGRSAGVEQGGGTAVPLPVSLTPGNRDDGAVSLI